MSHDLATCPEVFARLSEYLDGELSAELCEQMQSHIAGCAPCVEFVESLRKSIELCRPGAGSPGVLAAAQPAELSAACREALLLAYRQKFPQ